MEKAADFGQLKTLNEQTFPALRAVWVAISIAGIGYFEEVL